MPKIRVLIVDDHAVVRAGLRTLIGAESDMEVVGEASDGLEAVARARTAKPDVVILDLSLPGPRSSRTIEQLLELEPAPRVLILTMHDDPAYFRSAFQAGATGYVVKNAADVEVVTAVRALHRGRTFVDLTPTTDVTPRSRSPAGSRRSLSRREREVLRLLAQGYTHQEVADRLAVSIKTVETYRKRLHEKLELKSRAQLFRYALESGLLESNGSLAGDE